MPFDRTRLVPCSVDGGPCEHVYHVVLNNRLWHNPDEADVPTTQRRDDPLSRAGKPVWMVRGIPVFEVRLYDKGWLYLVDGVFFAHPDTVAVLLTGQYDNQVRQFIEDYNRSQVYDTYRPGDLYAKKIALV